MPVARFDGGVPKTLLALATSLLVAGCRSEVLQGIGPGYVLPDGTEMILLDTSTYAPRSPVGMALGKRKSQKLEPIVYSRTASTISLVRRCPPVELSADESDHASAATIDALVARQCGMPKLVRADTLTLGDPMIVDEGRDTPGRVRIKFAPKGDVEGVIGDMGSNDPVSADRPFLYLQL